MSLTSFLKDKEVKQKFSDTFSKPKSPKKREILAPPLTKNYGLVGTGFDYLLRFYLKRLNPNSIEGSWIAGSAFTMSSLDLGRQWTLAERIIRNAKRNYRSYLKSGDIGDALLKSCLLLAQLDVVYRANVSRGLGTINKKDIMDLKNLASLIDPEIFRGKKFCLLNPTFGDASTMIGGADADLVIDDKLIDIKTTKYLRLDRRSFDQLLGYYCLYRIGGLNVVGRTPNKRIPLPKKHGVRRLGIYYSRFGFLHLMKVDDLIDSDKFPLFINWFMKKACSTFPQRRKIKRKTIHLPDGGIMYYTKTR